MIVGYDRVFLKKYAKLPQKVREQFKEHVDLFARDPYNSILYNHPLNAPYAGCRSISITGDYRAVFYHVNDSVVRFINIGRHPELFGH